MKAARSTALFTIIMIFFLTVFFMFVTVTDMMDQWTRTSHVKTQNVEESSADGISVGLDYYGSYDGTFLSSASNSWSYFSDDGWIFDGSTDENGFLTCTNSSYPGAILAVRDSGYASANENDVIDHGVCSYSIDVSGATTAPSMTFNGVTWGASSSVIEAAYGEPDGTSIMSAYTVYRYNLEKSGTMEFYVYFGSGLQRVVFIA